MRLGNLGVVVGLVALFAPVSCGGDSERAGVEPATSLEIPEGYDLYDGSDYGFLIALPSTWGTWDSSGLGDADDDLKALLSDARPEVAELLQDDVTDLALLGMDSSGFPNLNVRTLSRPSGPVPWGELEATQRTFITDVLGGTVVSAKRVSRGGADGLHLVYEVPQPWGLTEQHVYMMVTDDAVFSITFTSANPAADREVFADVMETFAPVGD